MTETPKGPSRFQPDPIQHLKDAVAVFQKRYSARKGMRSDPHYSYRLIDQSARSGDIRSRVSFDNKWDCPGCREFKEFREWTRIEVGFQGEDMWVTVGDADDREVLAALARSQGHPYVALPIMGDQVVVLTTHKITEVTEKVLWPFDFIKNTVMKVRWVGAISSSRGFLPPAREPPPFWEGFHKATSRRCWHVHDTKGEAKACAVDTGQRLDGASTGWYTRSCSEWRRLGTLRTNSDQLERIINDLKIKSWRGPGHPGDNENTLLNLEAMEWDDPRFVLLRDQAKYRPPRRRAGPFQPPPFAITVQIDVRTGQVAGQARKGAS